MDFSMDGVFGPMCNGEVQIFQEDLDRFLNVAQRLKLEGLLTEPDADQDQGEEASDKESEPFNNEEKIKGEWTRKSINKNPSEPHHERVVAKAIDINPDNISEINEQIEQNIVKNVDGSYSCKVCGHNSGKITTNVRNHIETHHLEGLCFNCPMCEKTFRSRHALAMHKRRNHKY